ncbi:hypothetical protein QL285_045037 [Trifolium repens]|nr:hypothetical protein QL285_045037 [Trifolium repens]
MRFSNPRSFSSSQIISRILTCAFTLNPRSKVGMHVCGVTAARVYVNFDLLYRDCLCIYDHVVVYHVFEQNRVKQPIEMPTKARKKGTRPEWIGEEAWYSLQVRWLMMIGT